MELLRKQDPAAAGFLDRELARQRETLTLIASENHCSAAVRAACGTVVTDKYAEGYSGARYYGGCEVVDHIEDLAAARALQMFPGAEHANVQPHSGTSANMAVLLALAGPGGRIVGMALSDGGHLSHGFKASHTGKVFEAQQYGVHADNGLIDYDQVRSIVRDHRPALLIAGGSAYPRSVDWATMGQIAKEHDALLLADIAHPAGLIAGGVMPSPFPHADVVTMTTHKTLRGPRGGMILTNKELAKKIDSSVFPGGQGGPLMHQIAGKAVAFGEVLSDGYKAYARAVVDGAQQLASLLQDRGLQIVTGGTDSHIVLVDLSSTEMTGADMEDRCRLAGITLNKNMVPGDKRSPRVTSGIRVGTAAICSRGIGSDGIQTLGTILADIVDGADPESFRPQVAALCKGHPLP